LQTGILLADAITILPFINHEFKLQVCVLLVEVKHGGGGEKKGRGAPENLMFAGTYLATFRELLPPKSRDLQSCEIFLGKYSFVLNKINTFALNSID